MKASVIVTTYNRPDALAAVLQGLAAQTERDFEVLVADDGSGPETAQVVQEQARAFPVPLVHVWQEDQGFRAGAARNRAVAVDVRGMLEAMRTVYGAGALVDEMTKPGAAKR